jgi:hypothetical protein
MGSVFCYSAALWGAKVRACSLFAICLLFRWCFSAISLVFLCYSFGIARGVIRFFFAISLSFYWCFIGVSLLSKQRKGKQKVNNMQSNMYSVHRHKLCRMHEKANRFLAECH